MKLIKIGALGLSIALLACNNAQTTAPESVAVEMKNSDAVIGNYVSSEYQKRKEGYDWVAVKVSKNTDSTVHIAVRSRADLKKPTCTFDADAKRLNDSVYVATALNKNIRFTFGQKLLSIDTEHPADSSVLNYFCSGGGSLAGQYAKLDLALDTLQLAPSKLK